MSGNNPANCEHVQTHIYYQCPKCGPGVLRKVVSTGGCPDSCQIQKPVYETTTEDHPDRRKVCDGCGKKFFEDFLDKRKAERCGKNREQILDGEEERKAQLGNWSDSSVEAAKEVSEQNKARKAEKTQQGQGMGVAAEAGEKDKGKKAQKPNQRPEQGQPTDSSEDAGKEAQAKERAKKARKPAQPGQGSSASSRK
ncbi:hypothetical protein LTR37_003551 [Vermiconidia calcicola]|uniref:Uncharacterized protein n=1 Tax=Vermiconidia calcicola TaxID=1690605 RepID=A0ACC3NQA0_9PEZI|nr:hypothetical protein LTR37_003551 [Vermiconidia calcicola]